MLSFVVVDVVLSSLLIGRLGHDIMYHVTLGACPRSACTGHRL